MTLHDFQDRHVRDRLARLADVEVGAAYVWPRVHAAVRRDRRRRMLAGGTAALATAAALLLGLPLIPLGGPATAPAAPRDPSSVSTGSSPSETSDRLGMTFGDIFLEVEFDVSVLAQEAVPVGDGECVFIDPERLIAEAAASSTSVPDLSDLAAAGCRGGIVGQPLTGAVDPVQPFAGQTVSIEIGPCSVLETRPITTRGLLRPTYTRFDCVDGNLAQWVFDHVLVWSLDGEPRIADVIATAEVAVPR